MAIDENRVREIVKEELESYFVKALAESVKELNLISQDLRQRQSAYDAKLDQALKELGELKEFVKNLAKVSEENTRATIELRKVSEENTKAIQELRKQTEENTKAIIELRKQTEENTRAIQELRKQTEENTKAIQELRKQTEENTKAIQELRKVSEENTRAIIELRKVTERLATEVSRQGAKLDKAVKNINKRIGGLENTFGLIIEDQVRKGLTEWFKLKGVEVNEVRPKVIKVGDKAMEFDAYVEVGNKVYVAEVKTTLRVRDVKTFNEKVNLLRNYLKDKEVMPVLVYRLKSGDVEALAKGLGITVLKYMKGGYFEEK